MLLGFTGRAGAADSYTTQPLYSLTLPSSDLSYFTAADAFGADVTADVDGYPLRGPLLGSGRPNHLLAEKLRR